ncbi:MAG: hypothetical protein ACKVZJ_14755 [Phycisphaerales bacterium]
MDDIAPDSLLNEIMTDEVATFAPTSLSKAKRAASAAAAIPSCPFTPTFTTAEGVEMLMLPIDIKRHGGHRILVSPGGRDLSVCMNASEFEWVGFELAVLTRNTQKNRQKRKRQTPAGGICLRSGKSVWMGGIDWEDIGLAMSREFERCRFCHPSNAYRRHNFLS